MTSDSRNQNGDLLWGAWLSCRRFCLSDSTSENITEKICQSLICNEKCNTPETYSTPGTESKGDWVYINFEADGIIEESTDGKLHTSIFAHISLT